MNTMNILNMRRGFTLIELLLVLVIITILASITVPVYRDYVDRSKRDATIVEIGQLKSTLEAFQLENGRFPTSEEGLAALVQMPQDIEGTWHTYLEEVPVDKWGRPYHYIFPSTDYLDSFDIISCGKDGQEGTADDIHKNTKK
jgi:general secretion pathway protein G